MTHPGDVPRLIVVSGPVTGEVFLLEADEIVLGREPANAVAIVDPSLSRRHCAISRTADGWTLRDLGSFNGTFVNGESVSERVLVHGDRVRIAATELLFHAARASVEFSAPATMYETTSLRLEDAVYLRSSADVPEQARTQRDLLALVRIGTAIARIHQRPQLETELFDAAVAVTPACAAAFLRIDPETGAQTVVQSRTGAGGLEVRPSSTVVGLSLSKREALLANVSGEDRQQSGAATPAGRDLVSVLAVPVLDGEGVAGLLYLETSHSKATFDSDHLQLVTAIAGIGSVAMENVSRLEQLEAETATLKQALRLTHKMIGTAEPMQQVYDFIAKVSRADSTVLITGESGTGKELVARALHENSSRTGGPFVAINCAAITESLLESELFGHERGAFTDASATKRGKLEIADRGTLFLDEVGELSPALQAKLLRVLQFQEFERVGGTRSIKVDIRLISATHRDLEKDVTEGRFRQDLLFRLNVLPLRMPPLRERREDIPTLAVHFAEQIAKRMRRAPVRFSPAAMRRLAAYDWPGNVRELENAIERAMVLGSGPEIGPDDLPEAVAEVVAFDPAAGSPFHAAVTKLKRRLVVDAIAEANGRWTDAAKLLGLHPNYLHRLRRNLGLRD
jgi:transcriptional regulator with GAF, ATPase, and Fis domain